MPVDNSRLKGFYKLDVDERRSKIADLAGLSEEHVAALASNGELDDSAADRMIENVIGTMSLPVGVATNFIIDQKHYVVPFCLEESSVVAAASNMAKRCHAPRSALEAFSCRRGCRLVGSIIGSLVGNVIRQPRW